MAQSRWPTGGRKIAHVPAKACPRLDRGWAPVRRQEHAQTKESWSMSRFHRNGTCSNALACEGHAAARALMRRRHAAKTSDVAACNPPPVRPKITIGVRQWPWRRVLWHVGCGERVDRDAFRP